MSDHPNRRKPNHDEAIVADRQLRLCRAAGVEPAFGLAMDLAPLNRGVLLLVAETTAGRIFWVERAGLALDVRGPETVVHSREDFRRGLELRPPAVRPLGSKTTTKAKHSVLRTVDQQSGV